MVIASPAPATSAGAGVDRRRSARNEQRQEPSMSISSQRQSSWVTDDWDALVAREVARQNQIETVFDRADACERAGQFRLALEWLDRAGELSGGLSTVCRAQRAGLVRAVDGENH
jgi:hypothetical protein